MNNLDWTDYFDKKELVEYSKAIIDELIQTNEDVNPIFVDGDWCEIDTLEDLEIAREKIRD